MKAEQVLQGFSPVSIQIETQEELDTLYAALNANRTTLEANARGLEIATDSNGMTLVIFHMWSTINKLYDKE